MILIFNGAKVRQIYCQLNVFEILSYFFKKTAFLAAVLTD